MSIDELIITYGPLLGTILLAVLGAGWRIYKRQGLTLTTIEEQGKANSATLERLEKAFTTLNHNSSVVTRVLLSKGILNPEDIKDVDLA